MTHLGELGLRPDLDADDAVPVELDTFGWYGETFAVADRLSALGLLRMAWDSRQADTLRRNAGITRKRATTPEARAAADEIEAQADRDEMAAMYQFLRSTLAPGEWDRFEEVTHLAGADDQVMSGLIQQLIGVISARPTMRPSGSADGLSTSTPGSPGSSLVLSDHDRQVAELFFAGSTP
jgi:hypothetical protein